MVIKHLDTPLQRAVISGNLNEVHNRILEISNIEDEIKKYYSDILSPLGEAVLHGHGEIAQALIGVGFLPDGPGLPCLPIAISSGNLNMVSLLLAKGASVADSKPLYEAVKSGQKEIVKVLMDAGMDINARDDGSLKFLAEACLREDVALVKELLALGADPNAPTLPASENYTAIHYCTNNVQKVRELIKAGANVEAAGTNGNTPLLSINREQGATDTAVLEELLKAGVNVNALNNQGTTFLHTAVLEKEIKLVLAAGANIHATDNNGATPLHVISAGEHNRWRDADNPKLVKELISQGAKVDAVDNEGNTPLHMAREVGVAEVLIEHGADVQALNNNGETALYRTLRIPPKWPQTEAPKLACIECLLKHGANAKDIQKPGMSPLYLCFAALHDEPGPCVKLLLDHGADPNVGREVTLPDGTKFIEPVLCHKNMSLDALQILLDHGADFTKKDAKGRSPIYMAARKGVKQFKLLYERGANLNEPANDGTTAVLYAAKGTPAHRPDETLECMLGYGITNLDGKNKRGKSAAIIFAAKKMSWAVMKLVEAGANADGNANPGRRTPLHYTVEHGEMSVAKFLLENGADPNGKDPKEPILVLAARQTGWFSLFKLLVQKGADINKGNPLYYAASRGDCERVRLLLSKGADVNAQVDGESSLFIAAKNGHEKVVEMLVKHGVDIHAKSSTGETPLDIATKRKQREVVQFLTDQAEKGTTASAPKKSRTRK